MYADYYPNTALDIQTTIYTRAPSLPTHAFPTYLQDMSTKLICHMFNKSPFFFSWRYNPHRGLYFTALERALASSLTRFLDHTQRRATVGKTPLYE